MILPFQKNNHQKLFPLLLLLFTLLLPISVSAQSFDEDFLPTMEQVYDAVPYMEDSVTDNLEFTIDEQDSTPIEERLNNTTNKISSLLSKTSLLILFFSVVVLYIFFGVTQQKVAERLGLERSWQAWVPILRRIQLFKMGDQNPWFILLFLVPVLGQLATTVLTFIIYCKIAEKLGHDKLLGLLPLSQLVSLLCGESLHGMRGTIQSNLKHHNHIPNLFLSQPNSHHKYLKLLIKWHQTQKPYLLLQHQKFHHKFKIGENEKLNEQTEILTLHLSNLKA